MNLQEIDNFFSTWVSENNISSVIVRPDRYVYGIANDRSDLKNIEIAPIKKNSTGGANTFCNMGFISINY